MEKFSFEKFKKGAKVITGYGREVKDLTYFPDAKGTECLVGVIEGEVKTWTIDGVFNYTKEYQLGSSWDLCHPEEEMYVNLYKGPNNLNFAGDISSDLEGLKKYGTSSDYIGTYKLVKV